MNETSDETPENYGNIEEFDFAIKNCDVFISQLAAYDTPEINQSIDAHYNQVPFEEQIAIKPDRRILTNRAVDTIKEVARIDSLDLADINETKLQRLSDLCDLVFEAALVDVTEDLRHIDPEIDSLKSPFSPETISKLLLLKGKQSIEPSNLIIRDN